MNLAKRVGGVAIQIYLTAAFNNSRKGMVDMD